MMISSYALALVCLLPLTSASSSSSLRGSLKDLNPLDPTCLAAGMSSDDAQSLCDSTTGSNGQACVWCKAAGVFGLCVSSDASASMGQYLDCDDSTDKEEDLLLLVEEEEDLQSPLDPSCLLAGLQGGGDESTCTSAADQMGGACVWCTSPAADGVGLCLDADQADMAGQWLQCGGSQNEELKLPEENIKSPLDPTCIMAGMQGGTKEGCLAAQDQDGGACEWCFPSQGDDSMGLCLNEDQADLVSQYLTCEEQATEEMSVEEEQEQVPEEEEEVASPLDPTCVQAAWNADKPQEACKSTIDGEGASCVWCVGPTGDDSSGVCLSADQAAIAGQWLECQNHQGVQTVA